MARKSVVATTLIAVALIYAVFRYNIVRGVPWEQLPLYITNKGIALSAVLLIALSYVIGPLTRFSPKTFSPWLTTRKYFGLLGFGLAAIHGIISLLIFDPSYYPRFFGENGKLDFNGELSMLFGVISIIIFSVVSISSLNTIEKTIEKKEWLKIQRMGYLAFILVMLHVVFMGYRGWLQPQDWPGGLLPIILISFIFIVLTLLLRTIVIVFPNNSSPKH